MPLTVSQFTTAPAVIKWNGVYFFTSNDLTAKHNPSWEPVKTSMYQQIDRWKKDLVIKISAKLWGAYENIGLLFPVAASVGQAPIFGPGAGTPAFFGKLLFNGANLPLTIWAKDGATITYANAQITKLANLYLGVDQDLFSADLEFTCLLKDGVKPGVAGAYYVNNPPGTTAYLEGALGANFTEANYMKQRWTGTWRGGAGNWATIYAEKGWNIDWNLMLEPVGADGYGTQDYRITNFLARAKCIPLGPVTADLEAVQMADGANLGGLISTNAANLVITGEANAASSGAPPVVTLYGAVIDDHAIEFGLLPLRVGETGWETNRIFTAGVPQATATVV